MILAYGPMKKVRVSCRCGHKQIWDVPEQLYESLTGELDVELHSRSNNPTSMILSCDRAILKCGACKRMFELNGKGLKSISDSKVSKVLKGVVREETVDIEDMVEMLEHLNANGTVN